MNRTLQWRKSSYSASSDNSCVEVADGLPGVLPVRDSKRSAGPEVVFGADAWGAFIGGVKGGRLRTR
ncbi:DUF397 domain-containing protein [Streptomyces sp. ODS28]|uniref:DUF397 domain-containing protein n=1 Tax=Streptomyces sp. ODS28 TaxID=3136688 RepID=UPI0031E900E6